MNKATISIVSHGQAAMVSALLSNLARQTGASEHRYVITLNVPELIELEVPTTLPDVVVIRNATPTGFGENHNAAFKYCETPWFLVLNPDLKFHDPLTVNALLAEATDDCDGVLAPAIVDEHGCLSDAVRSNLTPWSIVLRVLKIGSARRLSGTLMGSGSFFWFSGMCLVLNAAAFRAIGGFDQRYFLYCEDYDLCARLYLAGYRLRPVSSVRVEHRAQRDSHRKMRWLYWHLKSLIRVWCSSVVWRIWLTQWQSK